MQERYRLQVEYNKRNKSNKQSSPCILYEAFIFVLATEAVGPNETMPQRRTMLQPRRIPGRQFQCIQAPHHRESWQTGALEESNVCFITAPMRAIREPMSLTLETFKGINWVQEKMELDTGV